MMASGRTAPNAATACVALFWAGMLAGVSLLATPVKFEAASLSLPVALEVGKVTFATFSKVEWLLSAVLAVAALLARSSKLTAVLAALVVVAVAFEAFWLLPVLDTRIDAVIAGSPLPSSWHHLAYAVIEVVKLVLLCAVALLALRRLAKRSAASAEEG